MTREEAIAILDRRTTIPGDGYTYEQINEAIDLALSALRPVSREQVEKVWRGKWIDAYPGTSSCKCTKCGAVQEYESTFCCHCGAPMTDEAVEMVMEKINNMEEMTNEH